MESLRGHRLQRFIPGVLRLRQSLISILYLIFIRQDPGFPPPPPLQFNFRIRLKKIFSFVI